jgi:hypothetical protein
VATNPNESIAGIKKRLLDGMVSFMEGDESDSEFDCGYAREDVDRCEEVVDAYLNAVSNASSGDDVRRIVKQVVIDLNELNDSREGCLIETDQREDLCELILVAARQAGLDSDDDITEEWREW